MIRDPALVVIDMQYDQCKRYDQASERFEDDPRKQAMVEATADLLRRYRRTGRQPILVRKINKPVTIPGEVEPATHHRGVRLHRSPGLACAPGTKGAELVDELEVRETDVVIEKNRKNAFFRTNLDLHLTSNDVDEILLCGVSTTGCVAATLRGARDRDYDITLLADCCASSDERLHDAMLEIFETAATITTSDRLELEPLPSDPPSG